MTQEMSFVSSESQLVEREVNFLHVVVSETPVLPPFDLNPT